jgi:hypothetical protein
MTHFLENNAPSVSKAAQLLLGLALLMVGCGKPANGRSASIPASPAEGVATYTYQVVHAWPHDARAFTQYLGSISPKASRFLAGRPTNSPGRTTRALSMMRGHFKRWASSPIKGKAGV